MKSWKKVQKVWKMLKSWKKRKQFWKKAEKSWKKWKKPRKFEKFRKVEKKSKKVQQNHQKVEKIFSICHIWAKRSDYESVKNSMSSLNWVVNHWRVRNALEETIYAKNL